MNPRNPAPPVIPACPRPFRLSTALVRMRPLPILALALAVATGVANPRLRGADTAPAFAAPEQAVTALIEAARVADRDALRRLFGLDTDELVAADQVQATNELSAFFNACLEGYRIVRESEDRCVFEVGAARWPFPIPLVLRDGGWSFDTAKGKEELLNRRIGRNELAVLKVIRAYVDAQREYAGQDRDGDEVLEYAPRFESTPGLKDGLYWPPSLDGEISPLGPLVAHAHAEGYRRQSADAPRVPFHGYYFKILTRQGRHAPGGAHDYLINGNMIAGFALVAWPAQYGESGIMTFIVNQQGRVRQKDLGPDTPKKASGMTRYDPDPSWVPSPD